MNMTKTYDPFYIALQHVAAPFSPAEAMPFLQGHADRLGMPVHCEINGKLAVAEPGAKEPHVVEAWVPIVEHKG